MCIYIYIYYLIFYSNILQLYIKIVYFEQFDSVCPSQHVLDFLYKEGCLEKEGDHFARAQGVSNLIVA